MSDQLKQAAQAVIDRWDSPLWKNGSTADAIADLRAALEQPAEPVASSTRLPRWVVVFEEEAKKPLSVIGLKRDDIKQAVRDYKMMQDLYESVANIRDAAVRLLAEAQGQKTSETFNTLNLDMVSRCIDHHAEEVFRLRAKVQQLEVLLEQKK